MYTICCGIKCKNWKSVASFSPACWPFYIKMCNIESRFILGSEKCWLASLHLDFLAQKIYWLGQWGGLSFLDRSWSVPPPQLFLWFCNICRPGRFDRIGHNSFFSFSILKLCLFVYFFLKTNVFFNFCFSNFFLAFSVLAKIFGENFPKLFCNNGTLRQSLLRVTMFSRPAS